MNKNKNIKSRAILEIKTGIMCKNKSKFIHLPHVIDYEKQ